MQDTSKLLLDASSFWIFAAVGIFRTYHGLYIYVPAGWSHGHAYALSCTHDHIKWLSRLETLHRGLFRVENSCCAGNSCKSRQCIYKY